MKLDGNGYQEDLQELIAGIQSKVVPRRWLITPDAQPKNIVHILKEYGFAGVCFYLGGVSAEEDYRLLIFQGVGGTVWEGSGERYAQRFQPGCASV